MVYDYTEWKATNGYQGENFQKNSLITRMCILEFLYTFSVTYYSSVSYHDKTMRFFLENPVRVPGDLFPLLFFLEDVSFLRAEIIHLWVLHKSKRLIL